MGHDETATVEEVGTVSVDLPRSCIEWLDVESVRWKHRTGASFASKSAVVVELLKKAMTEGEAAAEPEKKGGRR